MKVTTDTNSVKLALNKALQHFSAACQELYGKREQYLATD
jgi:hypothetical protein